MRTLKHGRSVRCTWAAHNSFTSVSKPSCKLGSRGTGCSPQVPETVGQHRSHLAFSYGCHSAAHTWAGAVLRLGYNLNPIGHDQIGGHVAYWTTNFCLVVWLRFAWFFHAHRARTTCHQRTACLQCLTHCTERRAAQV